MEAVRIASTKGFWTNTSPAQVKEESSDKRGDKQIEVIGEDERKDDDNKQGEKENNAGEK